MRFPPLATHSERLCDTPRKGDTVSLPASIEAGVSMYLGAVDIQEGKLISTGSRTVAFVGVGDTLEEAEKICASATETVGGKFFSRTDIGTRDAISRRVQHMRELRTR